MNNIVLFGAGPHAQYCIDIIEKEKKYNIIGIIDINLKKGTDFYDYKVIGTDDQLKKLIFEYNIFAGIITIGDNWSRKYVYDNITNQIHDFKFVNAIHPSTIIGKNVKMGHGIVTMAGCIINPNCDVGNFCFFCDRSSVRTRFCNRGFCKYFRWFYNRWKS